MERHFKQEKLKIEVLNIREEREHFHQDIELLFVLEGTLDVAMGEQTTHMQPEDILVINANKRHCLKGSPDILFARLYITYQLVSDIFESTDIIFWCDSTKGDTDRYREMRETLKKLLNHYLSTRGGVANFGHIALCYQVMDLLSSYFLVRTGDRHLEDGADLFENRLSQINNYIRANYNQSISLNDLASQLYLSVGYLSRFFKKNYGMNFAAYLANVRLYHAVDDLLYTEQPVTRIAYDNGFSNVTVFNKAFKAAYGETPSAFRKQAKVKEQNAQKEENDQLVEERLEEFLRNNGLQREEQKTKEEVRIEFSVQTQEQTKYIWKDMINIGAAEDLLRSEIREHVIYLKEALQFHYVRFWNIFSKDMLIDISSGEEGYNFSRLDSILDFLLQNGLKPHIELGMKPRRLYGSVQTALIFERNEDAFPGDEKWKCVLDAMMRHLLHRYGRTEIGTWRMELWFREDTEKNWEGMKGYFRLFNITYEVIHRYSEEIQVGGGGFRFLYDIQNVYAKFLEEWKKEPYFPDYLSFLYYAYQQGEVAQDNYSKRLTDSEGFLHYMQKVKRYMAESGIEETYPVYVTEWNLTISDRNYINDTCFKGAYVVKNILDCYPLCEGMALFQGSDRISEYYDSHDMLYGGTGIITKDGILKPAGFAFDFLNRLLPYYIGKGENCILTTDGHGSYGILCHNAKKLNYNYYLSAENELDKENIWKYFEDREAKELAIRLRDVRDGVYQMKTYSINEKNGSVLDIWAEMEYESELTRNDIKYFRRTCEPRLKIQKVEAKEQTLDLDVTLAANEIAFIRLKWFA